nr:hypothetical protein [Candidatus Sigynarchaeota archaeon]
MTLIKGKKCPKCSKTDRIIEAEDKTKILYYNMQGSPVYKKQYKCGNCGHYFPTET